MSLSLILNKIIYLIYSNYFIYIFDCTFTVNISENIVLMFCQTKVNVNEEFTLANDVWKFVNTIVSFNATVSFNQFYILTRQLS